MNNIINKNLDIAHYQNLLTLNSRVQIPDFLNPDIANSLRLCLLNDTPWDLTFFEGGKGNKLTPKDIAEMSDQDISEKINGIINCSPTEYQFLYDSYMIVTAYLEGRNQGHLLHQFLEAINSPTFLDVMKRLTSDPSLLKLDSQGTRYAKGHFLKEHIDADSNEGRRFAYVLNLSKNWKPDWGGLLHFNNEDIVIDTLMPKFNSMSIFEVPQKHFVSSVTGFAGEHRISLTGWMYNK